tara:strand:+ start:64 stop:411 length:348 start_codon:yes stop_codon:yes gene_type:complete
MDKYCDRCGEMNLLSFIDCNLRPFDIYCSESCIDSHWDDIENKKWDEYDGYDKGLKDFYSKEIKEGDINPKFWRKWFVENSKFFMWDEKKSKYKLVNEKDYISHYQLREEETNES